MCVPFCFAESMQLGEVAQLGSGNCPWSNLQKTITGEKRGQNSQAGHLQLEGFPARIPHKWLPPTLKNLISQATDKDSFLKAQGRKRTSQVHSKVTVLNKDTKNYLTLSGS